MIHFFYFMKYNGFTRYIYLMGLEQTPNYFLLVYFDMFSIRKDENCVKDGEEVFVTAAEFS
jgi:hypothetical protein